MRRSELSISGLDLFVTFWPMCLADVGILQSFISSTACTVNFGIALIHLIRSSSELDLEGKPKLLTWFLPAYLRLLLAFIFGFLALLSPKFEVQPGTRQIFPMPTQDHERGTRLSSLSASSTLGHRRAACTRDRNLGCSAIHCILHGTTNR